MDTLEKTLERTVAEREAREYLSRLLAHDLACQREIRNLPKGSLLHKNVRGADRLILQFYDEGAQRRLTLDNSDEDAYCEGLKKRKALLRTMKEAQDCVQHLSRMFEKFRWTLPPPALQVANRPASFYKELPFNQDCPKSDDESWFASLCVDKEFSIPFPEQRIHLTAVGERVRSKTELDIANTLFSYRIPYRYELPLIIGGRTVLPDFVARSPEKERPVIIEHLGLMDNWGYRKNWLNKMTHYAENGFLEGDNLIVTFEHPEKGFDSARMHRILQERFGILDYSSPMILGMV